MGQESCPRTCGTRVLWDKSLVPQVLGKCTFLELVGQEYTCGTRVHLWDKSLVPHLWDKSSRKVCLLCGYSFIRRIRRTFGPQKFLAIRYIYMYMPAEA